MSGIDLHKKEERQKLHYKMLGDLQNMARTLEKRCEDELRRRDVKIMQELDKKVMDQQGLLEKAGVPGFFVTNVRHEIQLQMYLLDFICRLAITHSSKAC
ncbi:hypothetical protein C0Q70_10638 [Pomacea canaliculata]|uniref:Uncharacterized protein n=1 Tax=Pomacea canaliculata TaxID=400727 RepID=A0A2T7P3Q1_POMCA|nr:hypothetical protein C0Q70_10638 [Pomacea canaliculata]